jgi:hypothetical protein
MVLTLQRAEYVSAVGFDDGDTHALLRPEGRALGRDLLDQGLAD